MKKIMIEKNNLEQFTRHLNRLKYSVNTIKSYCLYYNKMPDNIKELSQQDINSFIDKYNHIVARSFLKKYLKYIGHSNKFVIPEIAGRKRKSTLKYLTKEEVFRLASQAKEHKRNGLRNYLIIILLFETGLRASELCALKKESFDFDNNLIKGIGKGNKEFNNLLFSDNLKPLLFEFVSFLEPNERIFKIGRWGLWNIIKTNANKIFPDRIITPHCLRHSCATYLKLMGMDLKDLQYYLRHERLDTVGIYAHVDDNDFKRKWNEIMA